MKLNAYTIYDVASGSYSRPWFAQADGMAKRGFSDIANDPTHDIGKHPEDYTLFRVGDFNERTGTLRGEGLEKIATALEMVSNQLNTETADNG